MFSSWLDGLAVCAIIHHFITPGLIDFAALRFGFMMFVKIFLLIIVCILDILASVYYSPDNILENNTLTFMIAEE